MKAQYVILVDIDTEKPGTTCARRSGASTFVVALRNDVSDCRSGDRVQQTPILLHELGHVAAAIMDYPMHGLMGMFKKYSLEPLEDMPQTEWPDQEPTTIRTVDMEQEAWDAAKEMCTAIFKHVEERCIMTYVKAALRNGQKESFDAAAAEPTK